MKERFFYLSIGGLIIKITVLPHKQLHYSEEFIDNCLNYFKKFFLNKENKPKKIDFEIMVEDELDIYKHKEKNFFHTLIFKRISKNKIITYSHISFIHFNWLLEQLVYELIAKNNGFVFHCSAVKKDGEVFIFTADDGGGKSTAMLMLKDNFTPVSDDAGIIRKIEQRYLFFPSPFRSAHFDNLIIENKGYSIKKIFLLKKAKFFKTKRIKENRITSFLIQQLHSSKDFSKKAAYNLFIFIKKFKNFYFLYFTKEKDKLIRFFLNN